MNGRPESARCGEPPGAVRRASVGAWVLVLAGALASTACNGADPRGLDGTETFVPDPTGGMTEPDPSATSTGPADGTDPDGTTGPDASTGTDETAGADTTTTGPPIECMPVPSCDAPLPSAGPTISWEHTESYLVEASGAARHRGRDMFYNPGEPQWVMAKFAYGPTDWDMEDERVDLFLLRGCEGDWESLGPVMTTFEGDHATVENVVDTGGRLYFQMPPGSELGLGRHRIHMVMRGDDTRADTYIEIVEPGTPIILSDIDGTLTTFEWERFVDFLLDNIPDVHPGAPEALQLLVDRGYRPMYLTARPEFLGNRTYAFIEERGLPPGIIHTTLSATGAMGTEAVTYKTFELATLATRGLVPAWVFGNTDSDAQAYENAGILPLEQRIFFEYEDVHGGRTITSYLDLLPELGALPPVCE